MYEMTKEEQKLWDRYKNDVFTLACCRGIGFQRGVARLIPKFESLWETHLLKNRIEQFQIEFSVHSTSSNRDNNL